VEARAAGGFGAKQKPNSLQLEQLERHESGVFRIDKDLSTKPTSLKATIRLEHTCGDFSLIGEFSNAQEHCLQKFINLCMKHGKKNKSYKIISNTLQRLILAEPSSHKPSPVGSSYYDRFTLKGHGIHASLNAATPKMEDSTLRELLGDRAFPASRKLVLLMNAIENVKPIVEVKKVRISGTTQLVPSIIPKNRQICLAIRWIVEAAISRRNTKKSMTLDECFFAELIDASQNIGTVRKRRDDLHKLAESNRGFAHYRWW
jgi:ribosomal protein S7